MDLLLVLFALGAIVSVSCRAMGPRPSGWNDIPEVDLCTFQRSFGIEPD